MQKNKIQKNKIQSQEGKMDVFSPDPQNICLGGAYFEGEGRVWIVFTGDAFKKRILTFVDTASQARDALELEFGKLEEIN